jgi:hypothetical protein
MSSRTQKRVAYSTLFVGLCAFITLLTLGQTVPPPVLTIAPINPSQFQITITNAVATTNYEIYRTPVLNDPEFPWTLHIIGAVGQSNFTVDMGVLEAGFFRAALGSDWDSDGVANFQDADPADPTIGILSLTIDSPTNGMVLQ